MGRRPEQTFFQKEIQIAKGTWNVVIITNHQGNANQSHSEIEIKMAEQDIKPTSPS